MLALVLAILAAVSSPNPLYVYELHPTEFHAGSPSCGATRLKKDKLVVRVWSYTNVTVNDMRWEPILDDDSHAPLGLMRLYYRKNPKAHTFLVLDLYTNDRGAIATYTLYGMRADRTECSDSIELKGDRS